MVDLAFWQGKGFNSTISYVEDGQYVNATISNERIEELNENIELLRAEISKMMDSYNSGDSKYNGSFHDMVLSGTLTIAETINHIVTDTTNLQVEDKTITVNKNGANLGDASGLLVDTSDTYKPSFLWYNDGTTKRWGVTLAGSATVLSPLIMETQTSETLPTTGLFAGRTVLVTTTGRKFTHNGTNWTEW